RGDHLQAREGPRPHHARRGARRVHAPPRRARRRAEAPADRQPPPRLEADAAVGRPHPPAPPRLGHGVRARRRGGQRDHDVPRMSAARTDEAARIVALVGGDHRAAYELIEKQLAVLVLRTQVLLSLSGIVITVTGFSGRAIALVSDAARVAITAGIIL